MKQKVLLLYPYYYPNYQAGGPVQSLFNLVSFFRAHADFYLISLDKDLDGKVREPSMGHPPIRLGEWNAGPAGENIWYVEALSPVRIYRIIGTLKPDVILINGLFNLKTTLPGILAAKRHNIRWVMSPRGMLQAWALSRKSTKKEVFISLLRAVLGKNEEWHATDEQEVKDIKARFGREQRVHLASNIPRNVTTGTRLPFSADEKIKLVFLSLINPNKNLHLVIEAVKTNRDRFHLDIFGPLANAAYGAECLKAAAGFENIRYHGPIDPWAVPARLQHYHFFVLPTEGENFGHAIFDALGSGVPVMISRKTPWQNVDERGAGYYIDALDVLSMNAVLDKVRQLNDEAYNRMREKSTAYATAYLASKDYFKEYEFLLKS